MPATITSAGPTATGSGSTPSLTTPFLQPTECTNLFRTLRPNATLDTYMSPASDSHTTTYLTSDQANSRFSSCQPSGWDQAHFTFSPGLCPSSWRYYEMKAYATASVTVSQAYCCAPGYRLHGGYTGPLQCRNDTLDKIRDKTVRQHDAWFIQWKPSDNLPVSLPSLRLYHSVESWQPGETATLDPQDPPDENPYKGANLILPIVLPIVGFFLIIAGCVFCVRRERKLKRKERLEAAQAEQHELGLEPAKANPDTK